MIASLSGAESIPAGWAMDAEGVPTTKTSEAMEGGLLAIDVGVRGLPEAAFAG